MGRHTSGHGSRRRRWTAVASPWPENPEPAFRVLALVGAEYFGCRR